MTVEDPIEYRLPGVVQTQVNETSGYTFSVALRSFLRQNPNIISIFTALLPIEESILVFRNSSKAKLPMHQDFFSISNLFGLPPKCLIFCNSITQFPIHGFPMSMAEDMPYLITLHHVWSICA